MHAAGPGARTTGAARRVPHVLAQGSTFGAVPELTGVAHVSLTVRNLEVSDQWYRELFGFERIHDERRAHFDSVILFEPVSGLLLSLRRHHGAGTARFDETRTGLDHVSFGVADRAELESWERRLAEHHVEHSPIADTPFGAVLVFRDPDHIQLELSWRSREPVVPPAGASDPVADPVADPATDPATDPAVDPVANA